MTPRKGDIVEVVWLDAEQMNLGWRPFRQYIKLVRRSSVGALTCRSAGFLLYADKKRVVVVLSIDSDNGNVTQAMTIPRVCILKLRVLKRWKA